MDGEVIGAIEQIGQFQGRVGERPVRRIGFEFDQQDRFGLGRHQHRDVGRFAGAGEAQQTAVDQLTS